ncbi:flagellar assembly protein FliH [Peptoclostridium litorale DSM 5388]|uniref:Flagellar assembly protein FliH/Type III secretion system HrpE domain-containing protein n=1 Tax=Peptoclostridium litorale DSM 5388 TaxID=1121324 RepID=A0A069RDR5_PEPLI|nr:hypothetical protein CLIT_11c01900 [Peptoclostridium litorale DSM 5388]SIN74033.1 flagellar assembly protein FliH [Peptoclostridium litorale DSM 5388]
MYRVIKSDFVNLSKPKVISIQRGSSKIDAAANCDADIVQGNIEATAKPSESAVRDEVSEKFYELLREKESFLKIMQREKEIMQLEKERLEEEKRAADTKKAEANRIYEIEKQKGYGEGFQNGYDEGKKTYEALIDEAISLKKNIEQQKKSEIESLEVEIVGIVIESIEKIIDKKLSENDEMILNILKKGLERLSYAEDIVVRAKGEYAELFRSNKDKIMLYSNGIKDIKVRQDDSLGKGEVIVETSSGTVDSSVGTQIGIIKRKFMDLLESGG